MEFGRQVAFLRKKFGYSQAEFARKIDRSETWVSQVERGVRKIDRMSVLERLADALDVPLAELAPERRVVAAGTADETSPGLGSTSIARAIGSTRSHIAEGSLYRQPPCKHEFG